jgi:hypothetical protein
VIGVKEAGCGPSERKGVGKYSTEVRFRRSTKLNSLYAKVSFYRIYRINM